MTTTDEIRQALRKACDAAGSQKAWAVEHGFHPSFVGDVLKGKKDASEKILKALGYEWVIQEKK